MPSTDAAAGSIQLEATLVERRRPLNHEVRGHAGSSPGAARTKLNHGLPFVRAACADRTRLGPPVRLRCRTGWSVHDPASGRGRVLATAAAQVPEERAGRPCPAGHLPHRPLPRRGARGPHRSLPVVRPRRRVLSRDRVVRTSRPTSSHARSISHSLRAGPSVAFVLPRGWCCTTKPCRAVSGFELGAVPITSVPRTLRDCARAHVSPELVEAAVRQAEHRKLVTKAEARHILAEGSAA